MAQTLLLDRTAWDVLTDINGDIAIASEPYAQAQDIASQARTFLGECYYDLSAGIPYLRRILGQPPPIPLLKAEYIAAALSVPGIASASFFVTGFKNRELSGQIQAKAVTNDVFVIDLGSGIFVLDSSTLDGADVLG